MKLFGDRMNLRAALAGVLLGAVMQAACVGDDLDGEAGDPATSTPGPSGTKPDLAIPWAVPGGPLATIKGAQATDRCRTPAGATTDGGAVVAPVPAATTPPAPDNVAGTGGVAVAVDGQPAGKLEGGAICAADDECASGSCGSIVVPPDPADPYDLGYTYTGCR